MSCLWVEIPRFLPDSYFAAAPDHSVSHPPQMETRGLARPAGDIFRGGEHDLLQKTLTQAGQLIEEEGHAAYGGVPGIRLQREFDWLYILNRTTAVACTKLLCQPLGGILRLFSRCCAFRNCLAG